MMLGNVSSYSPVFGRLKLRILGLQFSIDLRIQRNKNGKHVVSRVESNISPKPSRHNLRSSGTVERGHLLVQKNTDLAVTTMSVVGA